MCRSENYYIDAETFNPDRWLNPESPCYKEPLTEFPKLQGHTVFGWGRRVCIGQDYAAAQMLCVCAAVSYALNIRPGLDKNGKPLHVDITNATPNVIPILSENPGLIFEARSAAHVEKLRSSWTICKAQDEEFTLDECA